MLELGSLQSKAYITHVPTCITRVPQDEDGYTSRWKIKRMERAKGEEGKNRGRREERLEDKGLGFRLYHSLYGLTELCDSIVYS